MAGLKRFMGGIDPYPSQRPLSDGSVSSADDGATVTGEPSKQNYLSGILDEKIRVNNWQILS
jgi:hypothetical protein